MSRSLRTATLVKTVLTEAIRPADDEAADLQFRIEVFAWSEQEFSCQVWRLDTYTVQPTVRVDPALLADETWLVMDGGLDWRNLRASTADKLLILLSEELERRLGLTLDLP
jgi:hypothetical protein